MVKARRFGLLEKAVVVGGKILGGLGVGVGLVSGGCNQALARPLAYAGAQQVVVSSVRKSIEGPRGTTVNVNNPAVSGSGMPTKKGRITISRWDDYNNNGADEQEERLGDIGDSVNLSNIGLRIAVDYYSGKPINISYTFLDSNDNVVSKINCFEQAVLVKKNALPQGEYTLVAQHGNVIKSRKFTVTRNYIEKSNDIAPVDKRIWREGF